MNAKTEEAIELSNAAARLLSQGDATLPNSARNLADLMLRKALGLLGDEQSVTSISEAKRCDLPAVLKLLGIDTGLTAQEITLRITPKADDLNAVNVTTTVK